MEENNKEKNSKITVLPQNKFKIVNVIDKPVYGEDCVEGD